MRSDFAKRILPVINAIKKKEFGRKRDQKSENAFFTNKTDKFEETTKTTFTFAHKKAKFGTISAPPKINTNLNTNERAN